MSTTQTEVVETTPETPKTQPSDVLKDPTTVSTAPVSSDVPSSPSSTPETTKGPKEKLADAITAKDWGAAWTNIALLSAGEAKAAWVSYDTPTRTAFAKSLNYTGTKANQGALKILFDNAPDDELDVQKALFEARFNVNVGQTLSSKPGADFDMKGLRRCWTVLEGLPPKHVEGNDWLEHWTRYAGTGSGSGYYSSSKKESSIAYSPDKIDNQNGAADPEDPLYHVIRFNKVVRHEVGHAVDKQIGGINYCKTADGGGWEEHGAADKTLVETMVAKSAGAISTWSDGPQKAAMIDEITKQLVARKPELVKAKVAALPFWTGEGAPKAEDKVKALGDPLFAALEKNGKADLAPWYNGGGIALDGRVYEESYAKRWNSYDVSAYAKKVSTYQFRAPGEWFAEAYATYYEPDGEGNIGTKLAARDAKTKDWFDKNVHTA